MLVHLGIERGLNGELDQLLGEGAEIFFRLDVFGQLSGQCFEFVWSICLPMKVSF
jgi:hypothetical protein